MIAITPYLTFDGNCREAMSFYQKCLDAELEFTPFSQTPLSVPKTAGDRIMHSRLTKGAVLLMASDSIPGTPLKMGNNLHIGVLCESVPEIEKLFASLSDKGKVIYPLTETFWGTRFGMLTDRFGINWVLNLSKGNKRNNRHLDS